jgi:hypothetical protein
MRAVVGSILLLLAVCLVSLGVFFWKPRVQPIEPRVSRTIEDMLRSAQRPPRVTRGSPGRDEDYSDTPNASPPAREANTPAERERADADAKRTDSKDLAKIVENRRRIEQLPKGNIVLDGPSGMKVSETRAVHANVGFNVPIETLREGLRPGNQVDEKKLAVSSDMAAVLSGPGFKITATTPEQQSVAEGFPTVWSWDVEAKSAGDQELEATLYALVGDPPSRQRIASYKHKISVSVMELTWSEWLKSFRDEIDAIKGIVVTLSGLVTGVVGWLVLYSDRRKKKEAPSVAS